MRDLLVEMSGGLDESSMAHVALPAFAAILSTTAVVAGPERAAKETYRFIKKYFGQLGRDVGTVEKELEDTRYSGVGPPSYYPYGLEFPVYYQHGEINTVRVGFHPDGVHVGSRTKPGRVEVFGYSEPKRGLKILAKQIFLGGKRRGKAFRKLSRPKSLANLRRIGHYSI